jgi:hypothetical protein
MKMTPKHFASIFRVAEKAKHSTRVNAGGKQMEGTCASETSVDLQRTTRRYIPEDRILHNHLCEKIKSYINKCCVVNWLLSGKFLNLNDNNLADHEIPHLWEN